MQRTSSEDELAYAIAMSLGKLEDEDVAPVGVQNSKNLHASGCGADEESEEVISPQKEESSSEEVISPQKEEEEIEEVVAAANSADGPSSSSLYPISSTYPTLDE